MHHYEPDYRSKRFFKVKVTVTDNIIRKCLFDILSELLMCLQLNLVLWHIIIRWIVL